MVLLVGLDLDMTSTFAFLRNREVISIIKNEIERFKPNFVKFISIFLKEYHALLIRIIKAACLTDTIRGYVKYRITRGLTRSS